MSMDDLKAAVFSGTFPAYRARQEMQYSFPELVFLPGEEREASVEFGAPFKLEKLVVFAAMEEVRGSFRIRYSRLPPLDRDNVIAYSNVTRYPSKRRTTVEYREHATGNFVRSYRPENVIYEPVEAISYLRLKQIRVGKEPLMPSSSEGVNALVFSPSTFGMSIPAPTGFGVKLVWENKADIRITLWASIFGTQFI